MLFTLGISFSFRSPKTVRFAGVTRSFHSARRSFVAWRVDRLRVTAPPACNSAGETPMPPGCSARAMNERKIKMKDGKARGGRHRCGQPAGVRGAGRGDASVLRPAEQKGYRGIVEGRGQSRRGEPLDSDAGKPPLLTEEQRYRLLVEASPTTPSTCSIPRPCLQLEPRGRALQGLLRRGDLGKHFSQFYTPEDPNGRARAKPRNRVREGRFEREGWRIRKDGSRFFAHVVSTDPRQTGELIGFAKITRDKTARRNAEIELEPRAKRCSSRRSCRRSDS